MTNDHGLSGLFGEDGDVKPAAKNGAAPNGKDQANGSARHAAPGELPPVIEDADKSPLELLNDRLEGDEPKAAPPPTASPLQTALETKDGDQGPLTKEPKIAPDQVYDPFGAAPSLEEASAPSEPRAAALMPEPPKPEAPSLPPLPPVASMRGEAAPAASTAGGILCFLVPGANDRGRRRTLEALNVAAGNGAVRLRALPAEPDLMDQALEDALAEPDCDLVAFLSAGTEPADDWALQCQKAFDELPSTAAMHVRAANSDPLSPWSRVAFFMDEAERQKGLSKGFDTMVFRRAALLELGEQIGAAVRNGRLIAAIEGRGHRVGHATEARVSISTPSDRREVMTYVREQARLAARQSARRKNVLVRPFVALFIALGYPFRILFIRTAAKRAVGSTQFREVASKTAMGVFADRRVRAMTMLFPGKDKQ